MTDDDIKLVEVRLIRRPHSKILASAKIRLTCGILLSGIRVYADASGDRGIFLSFPTRKDNEGNQEKTYFPYNNEARAKLTERVEDIYFEQLKH
jgi:DNA-binding cell septation regulator SpoVG